MSDSILDLIDHALWEVESGGDAMRWSPSIVDGAGAEDPAATAPARVLLSSTRDEPHRLPPLDPRHPASDDPVAANVYSRIWQGEFPYHDTVDARHGWPGGHRYGHLQERLFTHREWTDFERAYADLHGIALYESDWLIREQWWDLPVRLLTVPVYQPIRYSLDVEPTGPVFEHRTFVAKRWRASRWETDPFANLRRLQRINWGR